MKQPGSRVDHELGRQALEFVAPLFERAVTDPSVGQSGVLYAVVVNPACPHGECSFEDAILAEHGWGKPRAVWDADYSDYARRKARVSWQTALDSGDERTMACWSQEGHGAPLPGGMVIDGIVVAVSGADPLYDEVLAGAVALSLRAAMRLREQPRGS